MKIRLNPTSEQEKVFWKSGERIEFVKTNEALPKLPKGCKYSDPRISYDGKYWYISFGYPVETLTGILTQVLI